MKPRGGKQKGFSLIELLIVVSIILVIAAIAIPRLLAARGSSLESRAGANTRTFATAAVQYQTKWGIWPATAAAMGGTTCLTAPPSITAGCVLDNSMTTDITAGNKIGSYVYTYAATGTNFTLNVDPDPNASNVNRHFFVDATLGIHYNDTAAASPSDPTL